MSYIGSAPAIKQFLGIEYTEHALVSWLRAYRLEILPDALFTTVSVLYGWVDPLDLIDVLEASLRVIAMETQLPLEEDSLQQRERILMKERMHRAQMEVSLFSIAMMNFCEALNTTCHSLTWPKMLSTVNTVEYVRSQAVNTGRFQPSNAIREKCEAWLLNSSYLQDTVQGGFTPSQTLLDSAQTRKVSQRHEHPSGLDDDFLSFPRSMKAWVDNVTYRAYIITSKAEAEAEANELIHTHSREDFKAKEDKTLDMLKSDLHILDLKKQRAQAEVDMFSAAIAWVAEFGPTVDGTPAGRSGTYESRPPDNYSDSGFSEFSISSVSSKANAPPCHSRL